mmetsp:Transcript_33173/g.100307  ORF Transcript_33173/g.100307 Transcript_33173/m.100307 type:complete len:108 (+) Transcript_33173:442-765(+)
MKAETNLPRVVDILDRGGPDSVELTASTGVRTVASVGSTLDPDSKSSTLLRDEVSSSPSPLPDLSPLSSVPLVWMVSPSPELLSVLNVELRVETRTVWIVNEANVVC